MKTAIVFLVAGAALLLFWYGRYDMYSSGTTIDIHMHDTYFVVSYFHFFALVFLVLASFFCWGGTIGTRFREKRFLIPALILTTADVYVVIYLYRIFHVWM